MVKTGGDRRERRWAPGDPRRRGHLGLTRRGLVAHGLSGVQLVIFDAHHGLIEAIGAALPGAAWQRRRTHYLRNLLTKVPKPAQPWVATLVRTIFDQPAAEEARHTRVVAEGQLTRSATEKTPQPRRESELRPAVDAPALAVRMECWAVERAGGGAIIDMQRIDRHQRVTRSCLSTANTQLSDGIHRAGNPRRLGSASA
jgi:Transposase, Mutator family